MDRLTATVGQFGNKRASHLRYGLGTGLCGPRKILESRPEEFDSARLDGRLLTARLLLRPAPILTTALWLEIGVVIPVHSLERLPILGIVPDLTRRRS